MTDVSYLAFLGSLALACYAWVGLQLVRVKRARRWIAVNGSVRDRRATEHSSLEGTIETNDALALRYTYEVGGKLYSGDRIFFGDSIVPAPVSFYSGRLTPGEAVTVYVNPGDPTDAVLELRAHPMLRRMVQTGTGFLIAAPVFFWLEELTTRWRLPLEAAVVLIALGLAYKLLRWVRELA